MSLPRKIALQCGSAFCGCISVFSKTYFGACLKAFLIYSIESTFLSLQYNAIKIGINNEATLTHITRLTMQHVTLTSFLAIGLGPF